MTAVHVFDSAGSNFPALADFLLVYMDGAYANLGEAKKRYPQARLIQCTVHGASGVRVIDVESGTITTTQGVDLALAEIKAGRRPWLYGSLSSISAMAEGMNDVPDKFDWWLAHPDGNGTLPTGYGAKQYSWPNAYPVEAGQGFDVSIANLDLCLYEAPK